MTSPHDNWETSMMHQGHQTACEYFDRCFRHVMDQFGFTRDDPELVAKMAPMMPVVAAMVRAAALDYSAALLTSRIEALPAQLGAELERVADLYQ